MEKPTLESVKPYDTTEKVFCIYDAKTKIFDRPIHFKTTPQALRAFQNTCKEEESALAKNPEDFSFFELGSYNPSSGTYQNHTAPISLATALEMRS